MFIRSQRGDCVSCLGWGDFDSGAAGERFRLASGSGHGPEVAAVDVLLVGGVEDGGAIGREADVFYLEVAGSE